MTLSASKFSGIFEKMPGQVILDGLVIRSYPSGEADAVLRLLTHQFGKISIFVRNLRSSKRRFSGNIEIFDQGVFEVRIGKGSLPTLTGFTPKLTLRTLRESFDKLAGASLLCECIDILVKEEQTNDGEHESLFEGAHLTLQAIEEADDLNAVCKALYLGLASTLAVTGFLPLDPSRPPSKKNLLALLNAIENCAERQLLSKTAFMPVLESL